MPSKLIFEDHREVKKAVGNLVSELNQMAPEAVGDFLKLDVLRETLDRRVGQVGRYERAVFYEAFKVLVEENFDLPDMEACWRAN
jgi:hypothetical protein